MEFEFAEFHFIRPMLLWLLLPALFALFYLKRSAQQKSAWTQVISPHLLNFLFTSGDKQRVKSGFWISSCLLSILLVAISGPSFRQQPVPVQQSQHARVILLDLSLSMDATDIKPSRIERAKYKLVDLLNESREGTVALVVYAGDAFIISPLTSDANTIANMVPTLSSQVMPVLGSRPDIGINRSIELLKNAKLTQGEIIWLTDGVEPEFEEQIIEQLDKSAYQLSILGIGSAQGAPIPLPEGNGFLKNENGAIVIPRLESARLKSLAAKTNAGYVELTADNSDIDYLQDHQRWQAKEDENEENNQQKISQRVDDGYWLVWLALAVFLVKLIRQPVNQIGSYFAPLLLTVFLLGVFSPGAEALEWKDLWLTKDQQANRAFSAGEFDRASDLFTKPQWKATAQYKKGDFEAAANNFDPTSSPGSLYNHGTALAKGGKLEQALSAYQQLLKNKPEHADALHNKKIVEELLKQQQEQEQKNKDQQDQENKQENKDQQQQNSEENGDQSSQQDSQDPQENEQDQQQEQQSQDQQSQDQDNQQNAQQEELEVSQDQRDKQEKDQALEHWLQKIPDDPGGLLRRKMYREYQKRGRKQKEKKLW